MSAVRLSVLVDLTAFDDAGEPGDYVERRDVAFGVTDEEAGQAAREELARRLGRPLDDVHVNRVTRG